jgi:hypothetical protein
MGDLRSGVYYAERKNHLDPNGEAHLRTGGFLRDLTYIQGRSYQTGRAIQANLTRSATVSVGYYYYRKNSPPSTAYAASGGWIAGPGGPRDDKVPAMLSDGEFVVNAKQAARFGALLQAINSGRYGKGYGQYATGGPVSAAQVRPVTLRAADLDKALAPALVQRLPSRGISARLGMQAQRAAVAIEVNNHYPQAEPTSVTINRSLAYAATIHGV